MRSVSGVCAMQTIVSNEVVEVAIRLQPRR